MKFKDIESLEKGNINIAYEMDIVEFYKKETKKALNSFLNSIVYSEKNFDDETLSILLQDSTIQNFEFCTEIFWKLIKQYLLEYSKVGVEAVQSPRSILKAALKAKVITDKELKELLSMIDDRNRTSHLYSKEVANSIYEKCKNYYSLINQIVSRL